MSTSAVNKRTDHRKMKLSARQIVKNAKSRPCMDCGQSYPFYVMDLDHRDPATKTDAINHLTKDGQIVKLREELAKCDVVCANCHRERTYRAKHFLFRNGALPEAIDDTRQRLLF